MKHKVMSMHYNWDSYIELQELLDTIEAELNNVNDNELAKEVSDAKSCFGMNTPGEYMGESYLVLKKVISKNVLSKEINNRIKDILLNIKLGFKAVGTNLE